MEDDAQTLVESSTRPELEEQAKSLGVTGTSRMNKRQLADAIVERSRDERSEGTLDEVERQGRDELEKLSSGPSVSLFGGELPVRALVAIGVFVLTFIVSWMLLWAILGGLGFGLGWIVGAVLGAVAVKLTAEALSRREPR